MDNMDRIILQLSLKHLDFAASTVAFMEWQGKSVSSEDIEYKIPVENQQFFRERLQHYRNIYRPASKY